MSHVRASVAICALILSSVGCAEDAEVELKVQGPVMVSFYEDKGGYPNPELVTLGTLEFASVGKQTHKMTFGEPLPDILVRAVEDTDGDGQCSPGGQHVAHVRDLSNFNALTRHIVVAFARRSPRQRQVPASS